ncbi:hypothetical protein [Aestuariimicrobium sp. Y1814]|uniref:hypothetical protein n=1 Tax=Aestuariimicrobium sp. Y1814 TaxID=3418742 RepID=UPI003DA7036C
MSSVTYPTLPASPISFGDLVSATLKLFSKHWWQYLLLAVIPSVLATLVSGVAVLIWVSQLATQVTSTGLDVAPLLLTIGVTLVVIMVVSALATLYCSTVAIGLAEGTAWGEQRTWSQAAARVRGVFGRVGWVQALIALVGALLVTGMIAALLVPIFSMIDGSAAPSDAEIGAFIGGALLFIVLGLLAIPLVLIWQTKFAFVMSVAALEHDQTGFNVYRRSWEMTKGHFWRILGYMVLASLITQLLVSLTNQVFTAFSSPIEQMFDSQSGAYLGLSSAGWVVMLLLQLLLLAVSATASMLLTLFVFVLYIDTDRRNRGEVVTPFVGAYPGAAYPAQNYPPAGYGQQPPTYPGQQPPTYPGT